jgi:hypothetical protein
MRFSNGSFSRLAADVQTAAIIPSVAPDPGRRLSRPGVLGSGTRVVALTGLIEKGQQSGAMKLAQLLGHGLWERLQWHTHESLQDLF